VKEYKRKPKMVMMEKRMEMKEKKRTPMKLKKKIKPKTRKFKDGKEVTYSDAKRRAYYDTFNEYASESAGVNTRKALRDIARNPKDYKPYKSKKK
jgi:phage/plasmid-associated DNA primase